VRPLSDHHSTKDLALMQIKVIHRILCSDFRNHRIIRMPNSQRHAKPANLLARMAQKQSLDLDLMVQSGVLTAELVRDSINGCICCMHLGDCETWLDKQADESNRAPFCCRNVGLLERLGLLRT
jgi:hypothetical protein